MSKSAGEKPVGWWSCSSNLDEVDWSGNGSNLVWVSLPGGVDVVANQRVASS